jgi:hypothetical protein
MVNQCLQLIGFDCGVCEDGYTKKTKNRNAF